MILKIGSKGEDVKKLQQKLGLGADGVPAVAFPHQVGETSGEGEGEATTAWASM